MQGEGCVRLHVLAAALIRARFVLLLDETLEDEIGYRKLYLVTYPVHGQRCILRV